MPRKRWIVVAVSLAAASLGFGSWSYVETGKSYDYAATYVGRQSCASCHAEQLHRWTGSHHDLAMDPATAETVVDVEAFADKEFTYFGVTSKFFRQDGKFYVTTDGDDGTLQAFEIKYVFGVDPLQQYMVEFPDKKRVRTPQGEEVELPAGRVQVLSIAWDTHNRRWFHLYPKQPNPPGDWLHWTGGGQNWNYMCAECHSTNLRKNYDVATNAYHTSWSEIDVSCEACHGPASEHVVRAESSLGFNDPRRFHSYALNKLKGPSSLGEIETCAQCHSRRRIVHGDYSPGRKFYDFYEAEKLDGTLYFADGQIKEELYEYGSFLQSRMFREGVRCSNCHDPHSLKPKFPGNALCTQCHIPAKYDAPSHHHHHQSGSSGAKCVECHMPERTYMEVDDRRDHSIRIPRPDLTKQLGVPNACEKCHDAAAIPEDGRARLPPNRPSPPAPLAVPGRGEPNTAQQELRPPVPRLSTDEAVAKIIEWYGPKRAQSPHFGEVLEMGRRHEPGAAVGLCDLARPRPLDTSEQRAVAVGPVVRASAVALLAGYPGDATRETLLRSLTDAEPLVRAAAIRVIDQGPDVDVRAYHAQLLTALGDPIRSVRTESARVLTRLPPDRTASQADRDAFQRVFQEWIAGQYETSDQAGTHAAIGTAYANLLKASEDLTYVPKAEAEFKLALRIDPVHMPTWRNYAALLDLVDRNAEAEAALRHVLELVPKIEEPEDAKKRFLAETHYELGWLLLREPDGKRVADAAAQFKASLDNEPNNPQALLYYGTALLGLNRFSEAEEMLTRYGKLDPQGPATLVTYAGRAARSQQADQARALLRTVLAIDPEARRRYPQVDAILRELGGL